MHKVLLGHREILDCKVQPGPKARLGRKATKVLQVLAELLVFRAQRVLQELLAHKA